MTTDQEALLALAGLIVLGIILLWWTIQVDKELKARREAFVQELTDQTLEKVLEQTRPKIFYYRINANVKRSFNSPWEHIETVVGIEEDVFPWDGLRVINMLQAATGVYYAQITDTQIMQIDRETT